MSVITLSWLCVRGLTDLVFECEKTKTQIHVSKIQKSFRSSPSRFG